MFKKLNVKSKMKKFNHFIPASISGFIFIPLMAASMNTG